LRFQWDDATVTGKWLMGRGLGKNPRKTWSKPEGERGLLHWWHEVILRPAKSNAKSLFACQNLAAPAKF